ncbi:MAG: class I SAM-dependent methyltransferase [Candidatus Falkowbacteria bacterium]|nr:class I SAM-dependent methyltransferase [Candidatus Falkowbacteria bacterium]
MSNKSEDIKEFWDEAALDYNEHMLQTGHYKAQAEVINLLEDQIKSPVIDLAAGTGYLSKILLQKNLEVTLNDFSDRMINLCKESLQSFSEGSFIKNNAEAIAVDKKFQTIICCNLFYYLQDRVKAIAGWKSILEDGGRIILLEEFPFQQPTTELMSSHDKRLMDLINPVTPQDIKLYFKDFKFIKEVKTAINQEHDLYGLVFGS